MKQELKAIKKCPTCKTEKQINDFAKDHDASDGRYYQCKQCSVLANRASKNKKKEGIIEAF
jgi:predicted  nucleic acid-binding Zn ribbon protein